MLASTGWQTMMQKLLTLAVVLLLPVPALADTIRLVCKYPNYSDKKGAHRTRDDFTLTFIVDLDKGTAYMVGNQRSTEVRAFRSGVSKEGLTFMEITPDGNVMTTTVLDPKGDSVHSRNTVVAGELVPTQYYGTCVFK